MTASNCACLIFVCLLASCWFEKNPSNSAENAIRLNPSGPEAVAADRPLAGPCPLKFYNKHTATLSPTGRLVGHAGVDFAACRGQPIIAIGDGEVEIITEDAGRPDSSGAMVLIRQFTPQGAIVLFRYAHLADLRVRVGDKVIRGQPIGTAWEPKDGSSMRDDGSYWAPHVHLQWLEAGTPVEKLDPMTRLDGCLRKTPPGKLVYPIDC